MSYRYVQGIDYGPRDGTLGISLHMSEGNDNLPEYLARHTGEDLWTWAHRVSGVSCNAAILSTGEIVQMLPWDHASGNLNPDDRAGEYGYYGGSHLRAVLGTHWPDPNTWTVSAELAGFRAKGPTDAQVAATIKWGLDMARIFPTIRGATGHHDQSPKECPGLTPNMKAIFVGLGGHGLWEEQMGMHVTLATNPKLGKLAIPKGTKAYRVADRNEYVVPIDATRDAVTAANVGGSGGFLVDLDGDEAHFVYAAGVTFTPAPVTDCADLVAAEHERTRSAAIAAVEALP